MKKRFCMLFMTLLLTLSCFSMAGAANGEEVGIDWVQLIFAGSLLIGVFALFPLVIYTNLHEKLVEVEAHPELQKVVDEPLEKREQRATEILAKIEETLTAYVDEEGVERITITKGKQARFMKRGLDYIQLYLAPEDDSLQDRVMELAGVYADRTERIYGGSKWILGCAIGVLVFMGIVDLSMLWSTFALIHVSGIVFYYMASRVPKYILDKRLERWGANRKGLIGGLVSALFAGAAVEHYVSVNNGPWKRDYESEFSSSLFFILIAVIAVLFIGLFIALFGVLNFLMNYLTNFLWPFSSDEKWYERHFQLNEVASV